MSIIGILKIMEVQEDDMEVQEEAVSNKTVTLIICWHWLVGEGEHFLSFFVVLLVLIFEVTVYDLFFFSLLPCSSLRFSYISKLTFCYMQLYSVENTEFILKKRFLCHACLLQWEEK